MARASALQAEGRRFDSDYLHKIKTSIRASFFCGDILRPPVASRQPLGACRCRQRRHRASPFSIFDENSVPPMRGCSRFLPSIRASFFCGDMFTPSRCATAPVGHAGVDDIATGHLRPTFPMETPSSDARLMPPLTSFRASFFVEIPLPPVASRQPRWGMPHSFARTCHIF